MNLSAKNVIRHITTRMAPVVCVALLLHSCTGSCSRQNDVNPVYPEGLNDGSEYSGDLYAPVEFNPAAIGEYTRLTSGAEMLDATQTAGAIVAAEAAINHLGRILDGLVRDGDAADTWHVVNDLSMTDWPHQTVEIIEDLRAQPLDGIASQHIDDLDRAVEHLRRQIAQLRVLVPKLPGIF